MSGEGSELSSSRLVQPLLELDVSVVTWGSGCALNNKMFLSGFIPVIDKPHAERFAGFGCLM